jgi:proteasome lid subunit RPN8/RPN11
MLETLLQKGDVNERCGVVLTTGEVVEIDNISEEPKLSFRMSPEQLLPYIQAGTVAETWHTHPYGDPNLSGEDHACFKLWPDFIHSIIGLRRGKPAVMRFRVKEGQVLVCD